MIISLTLNGEIYNMEPEQIYQGSNNVNEIFIIAPLSANTNFTMAFELPNGYKTQPYVLERIAPVSNTLNTWKLVVGHPLTQYYGKVNFQFKGVINGTTTASGQGSFKVIEGVDWVLPALPDITTYELLVNKIAQVEGAVINAEDNSQTALSKSEDALAKSEQALEGIADAISKGNEAYNLASSVETKASEALAKAETANTNASDALQVAEEAKTIASEKANSKVFDTYSDMVAWLRDVNNKGKVAVGTTLYIKEGGVSEYWITAVLQESDALGFYYEFVELESKLPDISNMVTTDTEQNIVGAKNFTTIKKNGYDLQGNLTSIDFASIDGMTTYANGKATIHGEFTTTTETDKTQNTFDGSIELGIKGSDTIVVEEDETGSFIEIHLDQSVEQRFEDIENGLNDKVGQSSVNALQQAIDQTNIDVTEIRNATTNNATRIQELDTAKADAIDLANLNAKALKTPLQAPAKLQVVAIDTNNAQTLVDLPEGSKLYDTIGQNTDGAMTQKAVTDNFALKSEIPTVPTNYVTRNTAQTITGSKTFEANANLQKSTLEYIALDYIEFLHPYLYKNTFKSNWSDFTRNVGTEYVFQMNNEFKIIVGTANFNSTAKTVTFSEPFSEGCYVVGSSNARLAMSCYDFTKTGFSVRSDSGTNYNFYYIAVGK